MKKISDTYNELGIAFAFPITLKDEKGNETYYERSNGRWYRWEYDHKGNQTYYEDSNGYWECSEYDDKGNETYFVSSDGTKRGMPLSASCVGKIIEVDGKKYKLTEV